MSEKDRYYKHSGGLGVSSLVLMIVAGVLASLLGGAVYGFAVYYIPLIYVTALITLAYGALVGWSVGMAANMTKVRSQASYWFFGIAFGLLAVYIGWVSWIFAFSKQSVLAYFPQDLLVIMERLSETGVWSFKGSRPTGTVLQAFWGAEALLIAGTSGYVAASMLNSNPFCLACHKWIDVGVSAPFQAIKDPSAFVAQAENGDFSGFKELEPDVGVDEYSMASLYKCKSCNANHLLSVSNYKIEINSDKGEEHKEKSVIENLYISEAEYQKLTQTPA